MKLLLLLSQLGAATQPGEDRLGEDRLGEDRLGEDKRLGDDRGVPERYLYEKPVCGSVEECLNVKGCDSKIFTAASGEISLSNYVPEFNCRWEVKGTPGSKISIKVEQGSSFGIENQATCGYDRLHIRSGYDEGFGRLCSSRADSGKSYNGMADYETINGKKIKSMFFQEWMELDTDHLVVAFDSDRLDSGIGFKLLYQISAHETASASEVREQLNTDLTNLIDLVATKTQHKGRLTTRLTKLFNMFDSRLAKCANGDQSDMTVATLDTTVFSQTNLELVKAEWLSFYRVMLNNCDLHIIRHHGSFDNTSWPRRIANWIDQLGRDQ